MSIADPYGKIPQCNIRKYVSGISQDVSAVTADQAAHDSKLSSSKTLPLIKPVKPDTENAIPNMIITFVSLSGLMVNIGL